MALIDISALSGPVIGLPDAMEPCALTPEKLEMIGGKLLWDDESRVALPGLLLENAGGDRAIHLGDAVVWIDAVDELKRGMLMHAGRSPAWPAEVG